MTRNDCIKLYLFNSNLVFQRIIIFWRNYRYVEVAGSMSGDGMFISNEQNSLCVTLIYYIVLKIRLKFIILVSILVSLLIFFTQLRNIL